MIWYIISGILFAIAMAIMTYNFVRDRRYMRKKTSETFSKGLKAELDEEREKGQARRQRFEEAMKHAEEDSDRKGPTA